MSKTVQIDQINEAINRTLTLYSQSIIDGVNNEAKKSMARLVEETKATAPIGKRRKHYRDSIKSKKQATKKGTVSYIWYVDGPDYRLSHLLENGHATKNGGRVEGTHFIQKATDPIIEDYLKAVEEVIKNG